MKCLRIHAIAALALAALAAPCSAAVNLLANPGFESPVTMDGAPFVGFWEAFSGGAGATSANSSAMPRTGSMHLDTSIINTDNTFAGAFQDVPGMTPGTGVTFSGWLKTVTATLGVGVEARIEWRNSVSNTEIGRTPNLLLVPVLNQYTQFLLPSIVPAGVDTARVVMAIQSFGAEPGNTGSVYFDDMSFTAIPEPSTLGLAGLAMCGIAALRRRRA